MGIKVGGHMNDDNNQDDINQVPASSPDLKTELAKKLQELVPEAIADGKVDTNKLRELLDEDTADDSERFGLFWPGKKRAMRAAQEPTTATLKPAKEESKDWDTTQNIFIEGDNLEVLKILQKHYHNKIKMIYIDPPYNTGKDFVYPDNYKEGLQSYLEFTKQVNEEGKKISTNSDTDGRYHSNWLNMMYPRLKLARNLLTDDGVIFISIDDHELDNLLKICKEIFGEYSYVAQFPWRKRTAKSDVPFGVSQDYEWMLCFAKSKFIAGETINRKYYETPDYPDNRWRLSDLTTQKLESQRPNSAFDLIDPKTNKVYPYNPKRLWGITKDTFDEYYNKGKIVFPDDYDFLNISIPAYRVFESEDRQKALSKYGNESPIKAISTVLPAHVGMTEDGNKEIFQLFDSKLFDFSKPPKYLQRFIELIPLKDFTVLDFFSGSSASAHAVMQLNAEDGGNRKFIQVQLPEPTEEKSEAYKAGYKVISDISKERIRRAGEKIKQDYADKLAERDEPLDIGFKVFNLADTNFSKWQTNSDVDTDSVQQRLLEMRESSDDNATQEDLLTEIIVKLGLPLNVKVTQNTIGDLNVWDVSDKAVIAYLDEHTKPTLDQLRLIADSNPGKIVILEDSFQGDDELKTNLSQICKSNDIELWTV